MAATGYKRSWKNLLINKRYQLRFTLFMVGLSVVLMVGLGIWVMHTVNETTRVAMTSLRGQACPAVRDDLDDAASEEDEAPAPRPSMKLPDEKQPPAAPAPAAGSGADERRPKVEIVESSMTLMPDKKPAKPPIPADFEDRIIKHWTCELAQAGALDQLEHGRWVILWVLVGSGFMLAFGLAVYGIKTTHRVAGPLFKVRLYFAKMRDGRFDTVYNLRRGDQLVQFYNHFKAAHAGVVGLEKADIERITAVIKAAEAAGAGEHESIVQLREILARKEKALE